jgi:hypothetical protein
MNAGNDGQQLATRPIAPDDLGTEIAEEEGSEMAGSARTSPMDRHPYFS